MRLLYTGKTDDFIALDSDYRLSWAVSLAVRNLNVQPQLLCGSSFYVLPWISCCLLQLIDLRSNSFSKQNKLCCPFCVYQALRSPARDKIRLWKTPWGWALGLIPHHEPLPSFNLHHSVLNTVWSWVPKKCIIYWDCGS